jgi:signal transduction histidine kinase
MKNKKQHNNEFIKVALPFPYISDKTKYDGILVPQPMECAQCKVNDCMQATSHLLVCSYGFEYIKINSKLSVFGITTTDKNLNNSKKIKHNRIKSKYRVHSIHLDNLISSINQRGSLVVLPKINNPEITAVGQDDQQQNTVPTSSFFHDYRQINSQLSQNMEVVLRNIYKVNSEEDIDNISDENIKALYYGIKLLNEKLDALSILEKPEQLRSSVENVKSNIHGIVKKYLKIYDPQIKHRNLHISIRGFTYSTVWANPKALTIIPHALIDNAIKYAPVNSQITIELKDEADHVYFSITSLGPKIEKNERNDIFNKYYRSKNAISKHSEGSGIGLYSANLVAQIHLNSRISVFQEKDPDQQFNEYYMTRFSVELPYEPFQ